MKRMRLAFVAVATVAMAAGATAYASADDVGALADKTVANRYGKIHHMDNGDGFRICDTLVNGKGVVGRLSDTREVLKSETDGGDDNCGYFTYNIKEGIQYTMQICGLPASIDTCTSGFLWE